MSKAMKFSVAGLFLIGGLFIFVGLTGSIEIFSPRINFSHGPGKECSFYVEELQKSHDEHVKFLDSSLRKFYRDRGWVLFASGICLGVALGMMFGIRKRNVPQ